jgi:hypothetical protein
MFKYCSSYTEYRKAIGLYIKLIIFQIKNKKKVDIFKIFKDEVNNVFDTNIFRQVKTGNFKMIGVRFIF